MNPRKDPTRTDREDAARLIERRTTELQNADPADRPDVSVWAQALVTELMTLGWRPTEARKTTWAPDTNQTPLAPAQARGYANWARRRMEAARSTEETP